MSSNENLYQPSTLQEAINIIKFLTTSHNEEINKWKDAHQKQIVVIKRLEANRKKELEFLSHELKNYEINLATKSDSVAEELRQKEEILQKQLRIIEDLNEKIKLLSPDYPVPEINIISVDSNSDSGIALENEENYGKVHGGSTGKSELKSRKCSRRFAESISFLRRVDFTPRKCKTGRDSAPKQNDIEDLKKHRLELPFSMCKRALTRQTSNDKALSDDDRLISRDILHSEDSVESLPFRSKPLNDGMNNHFSDDGSEDTSEEIFDRVMTRTSIRRSVKANPKYKKINRTKSKLLEQVKQNIID